MSEGDKLSDLFAEPKSDQTPVRTAFEIAWEKLQQEEAALDTAEISVEIHEDVMP